MSELASEYGVHPTMIQQGIELRHSSPMARALLQGAAEIFERGGKKSPKVDEETVRALNAKIAG